MPTTQPTTGAQVPPADLGIIGGSGFYTFLNDPEQIAVDTPYGEPSAPISIGDVNGRRVAFVPRHGERHQLPPHQVNYRANLWALRSVGVRQVLAPCAVGSLKAELTPGTFVVPDQVVDRTWGREHTVYAPPYPEREAPGEPVIHVAFSDPYCPRGRQVLLDSVTPDIGHLVDGGTLVVINGPRFSTRAESRWHAAQDWSVVGMTGMPEAAIARELAMCFSTVAMVTDHDAGVEAGTGVTHAEVLKIFAGNIDRLKELLLRTIDAMPAPESDVEAGCSCRRALDGMKLPIDLL